MKNHQATFDRYMDKLRRNDPEISMELDKTLNEARLLESAVEPGFEVTMESIVLTTGRPVLDVKRGTAVLEIGEIESQVWKARLLAAQDKLATNIPAVGRIELTNHPRGIDWLGTGWLLTDNIVVTNRHIAEIFGHARGGDFLFRTGFDGARMHATIDFLEEFDHPESLEFPLFKIMHIEKEGGPDLAFLRIEPVNGQELPSPVTLASEPAVEGEQIAVIGYPARDEFFPQPKVMDRIFGSRYDKKRLAPGLVDKTSSRRLWHDCSTLGGNSGSEIISLKSGHAVALHFAGTLFTTNHAIPAHVVAEHMDDVLRGRQVRRPSPSRTNSDSFERLQGQTDVGDPGTPQHVIEAIIPIHVRIELGDVSTSRPFVSRSTSPVTIPIASTQVEDDVEDVTEARPEDYVDRDGYNPEFLGNGIVISLPELTENRDDILTFDFNGEVRDTLNYRHFSVSMSRERRLCRYSACNIDGKEIKRVSRKRWRFDPRIPEDSQIKKECYGNPPKFSRGHMTRRNDPSWGSDATQGNTDSMHVTNAVPQIQPFNGGIWLNLEDYALENAKQDDMRISVITGPFLFDDDPVRFGIRIPIRFWKVIAFVHDETGELAATGYTMNQRSFIGEEEFIFGQHESSQRPISEIEQLSGISFGHLADVDPLRELTEAAPTLLTDPNQIRWC